MGTNVDKFFVYQHLPEHLQEISKPICELAAQINAKLPDCAEKSTGMRKLLEAQDSFLRAAMEQTK